MPGEEADHDGGGERLGQQVGVPQPLGVGGHVVGEAECVREPSQVDQDEEQLDRDLHPYPQVRADLTERLFEVTRRLPVAVVVQPHGGQREQRGRAGPARGGGRDDVF